MTGGETGGTTGGETHGGGADNGRRTALHDLYAGWGATVAPFAGWALPMHFGSGVLKEHLATRSGAGLFDVGHMGQIRLRPRSGDAADAARALERLAPVDALGLPPGRQRYTVLTGPDGGILDDLMVANMGDHLFLVVNAARAEADVAQLETYLSDDVAVETPDRALIALQGPGAETLLAPLIPEAAEMRFMDARAVDAFGGAVLARAGYSGEDGFEISVPGDEAPALAQALVAAGAVPAGLGARDSLRLEAGLPLYGADLDEGTSPVEAGLSFAVGRARREDGARPGGFPGAERILRELRNGPGRLRVGLSPEGRAPMRPGTTIFPDGSDDPAGEVTSGGYAPSLERPVSMAYLPARLAVPGTRVEGEVRGRRMAATVTALPFRAAGYRR